ncbi:hypothetical protein ACLB2K_021682 [Fragaria x ananassa]
MYTTLPVRDICYKTTQISPPSSYPTSPYQYRTTRHRQPLGKPARRTTESSLLSDLQSPSPKQQHPKSKKDMYKFCMIPSFKQQTQAATLHLRLPTI